jgi:hypothetical protein
VREDAHGQRGSRGTSSGTTNGGLGFYNVKEPMSGGVHSDHSHDTHPMHLGAAPCLRRPLGE